VGVKTVSRLPPPLTPLPPGEGKLEDAIHPRLKERGILAFFVKSSICTAHKPGKGEAYFLYVEPLRGEV